MTAVSVVAATRYTVNEDGCWIWNGKQTSEGYRRVKMGEKRGMAHRYVWELMVGPIPAGMTLDHVCHNEAVAEGRCQPGVCLHRACVNPAHLRLATRWENSVAHTRLIAECPSGHRYTDETVYWHNNKRHCRVCRTERMRTYRAEGRAS